MAFGLSRFPAPGRGWLRGDRAGAAAPEAVSKPGRTVFGYYGQNNVGDEAFKLVLNDLFADQGVEFVGNMKAASRRDHVIFGGGALFNDYFVRQLKDVEAVYVVGCSLPHGVDDLKVLKPALDRFKCFYLRSRDDVEVLRAAGIDAVYTPDIVFATPVPEVSFSVKDFLRYTNLQPRGFGEKPHTIVAFLSDDYTVLYTEEQKDKFLRSDRFKQELAAAFDVLAEQHNIVFVPMSVWYSARDYLFAFDVVRRMRHNANVCVVERYIEPRELLGAVNALDATIVSMKFHGLVFGLMSGKLVVNIGTTRKNQSLMRDAGLAGLSFNYDTLTCRKLLDTVAKRTEPRLLAKINTIAHDWQVEARERLEEFSALVPH